MIEGKIAPMFTTRHYNAIADLFMAEFENQPWHYHNAMRALANRMADRFTLDNPRFDRETFLKRAGVR